MLFWDKRVRPATPALESLSQPQRLYVTVSCIHDVRDRFDLAAQATLDAEARAFFTSAFALCGAPGEVSALPKGQSAALVKSMSWLDGAPPAAWDMAISVAAVLRRAGGTLSVNDVLESMGCAYQVVLREEVLSKLKEEATESEVARMEEATPACVACIEAQLRHVADAPREARGHGREQPQ